MEGGPARSYRILTLRINFLSVQGRVNFSAKIMPVLYSITYFIITFDNMHLIKNLLEQKALYLKTNKGPCSW